MARGYTKEDVISAYLMRFVKAGIDFAILAENAEKFYEEVGKDKFREYASVTPEVMKEYFKFIS